MTPCYLVVDVGTTNTKGVLLTSEGDVLHVASQYAGVHSREGHLVQDADQVWAATVKVLKECTDNISGSHDIQNLVIGGNQSALVWVAADHSAVTHIDSWLDTHYYEHMTRIAAHLSRGDLGSDIVEKASLSNFVHLAKAYWWLTERPESVRDAVRWATPGSYVAGRLAGLPGSEAYIDVTSTAYSGLIDVPSGTWLIDLCREVGLPADVLPTPRTATDQIGGLRPELAPSTGLRAGTPVLAGCGDFPAAALGAGTDFETGVTVDIGGTTSLLAAAVPKACYDSADILRPSPAARAGEWYLFAHVPGGRAIEWFDGIAGSGGSGSLADLEQRAKGLAVGSDGLVFVPHLGGRMSPPDAAMRGSWIRFSWEHGAAHFYRSILEAVAFEYSGYLSRLHEIAGENFPGYPPTQLRVVGSAANNQLWNQIKADCTKLPVYTSSDIEATARGLAIVGAVGAGVWTDWKEASAHMAAEFTCVARPSQNRADSYEEAAHRYREVIELSTRMMS